MDLDFRTCGRHAGRRPVKGKAQRKRHSGKDNGLSNVDGTIEAEIGNASRNRKRRQK